MLKFFKELFAPAIFIKGVLRYTQNNFAESKEFLQDAGKRKPDLTNDNFYKAVLLLVEYKLGSKGYRHKFQEALDSLKDSQYQNTNDYSLVVADLKQLIDKLDT